MTLQEKLEKIADIHSTEHRPAGREAIEVKTLWIIPATKETGHDWEKASTVRELMIILGY